MASERPVEHTDEAGAAAPDAAPRFLCPSCGSDITDTPQYTRLRVCETCHRHFALGAAERIASLVDYGTFRETSADLRSADPLGFADRLPYPERLAEARRRTGLREAAVTGTAHLDGHECVLAVLDFNFLGGTMGTVVGEKVTLALELAAERKLPCIAVCSSGGARMQEGMLSLVQMAKTTAAAVRLHAARVPFITVLTDPTTGGIYASFANQGDVILAEPGALIGFAGPRVIEQTTGEKPPEGSHRAEFLLEHGMIDAIVERPRLRGTLAALLGLFAGRYQVSRRGRAAEALPGPEPAPPESAWDAVRLARHPERPTSLDYIRRIVPNFVELHGDRAFGDDPAVITGLGDLGERAVVVVGQERGHGAERKTRREGRMYPEGYRKVMRMLRLAARWNMPVLTFIDTPGAYPGFEAEARGLAMALAECIGLMSAVPVPVVATVIGEGGSGGALALAVADQILMLENAIYSVIAPEGAAAILYRDAGRAAELASALKLTARDCKDLGVVDTLVPEPEGGAHLDPDFAATQLRAYLLDALLALGDTPGRKLVEERYRKFRRMGREIAHYQEVVDREVGELARRVGPVSRAWSQLRVLTESLADRLPHRGEDSQEPEAAAEDAAAGGGEAADRDDAGDRRTPPDDDREGAR
ncbi:MAG TPA: acetyl-CoA carboxylase carboxyltransferase subunit alpha/beta [Thermomicrobiales bacterium]|nr:acetyl-CoA carboxylase carboxyltransferase subunit alpha/beta [Thermomicrobiales bacterium]